MIFQCISRWFNLPGSISWPRHLADRARPTTSISLLPPTHISSRPFQTKPGAQGVAYCSRTVARIFLATGGLEPRLLMHPWGSGRGPVRTLSRSGLRQAPSRPRLEATKARPLSFQKCSLIQVVHLLNGCHTPDLRRRSRTEIEA